VFIRLHKKILFTFFVSRTVPKENYVQRKETWKIFEDDTKRQWFPRHLYKCHHETPRYDYRRNYYNSDLLKPDFGFRLGDSGVVFWVECKERSISVKKTQLWLFKEGQRSRYLQYGEVLIFIKLLQGEEVKYYLVPLAKLPPRYVELDELSHYRVWQTDYIRPALIKNRLADRPLLH